MTAEPSFTELADGPCSGTGDLLLSLTAEFWPVDAGAVRARLDDEARRLFGAAAFPAQDRALLLAAVLGEELRLEPEQGTDPALMRLDRLLLRRRGHPLCVAALGVELLRRAGVPATVCSSPTRWFVGPDRRASGRCCSTRAWTGATSRRPRGCAATAGTRWRSAC